MKYVYPTIVKIYRTQCILTQHISTSRHRKHFGWWLDFYECGLFCWKDITIDSSDEAQNWDLKPLLHEDYDILCLKIIRILQTSLVEDLISQIFFITFEQVK